MKIYIGYNPENRPIGVLLAESQGLAELVWSARDDKVVKVEEIDPNAADIGTNGVVFLLTTYNVPRHQVCDNRRIDEIVFWKRGK